MFNRGIFSAGILTFCAFSLSACSGGGGGGGASSLGASTPAPATPTQTSGIPVNLQAAKTTVAYPAAAVTAIGAGNGMGNVTITASGQGPTVTLTTDASGNLSFVDILAGKVQHNVAAGATGNGLSLASPSTLDFTFQLNDTLAFPEEQAYTISQVAAGQGLTSSAYGIWASTGKTLPGDVGLFAFGNLTPATSVPATGSATFNGSAIGAGGTTNGGATYFLKGNAQIIANFASQTVTTNLTNFVASSYATTAKTSVPDLTGASTISGNAYTGPLSGGGLTGTINGNFYGSAAQETAGVWQASGGGNSWIGSFGAK